MQMKNKIVNLQLPGSKAACERIKGNIDPVSKHNATQYG